MNSIRRSIALLGFGLAALGAPRFAHATGEHCTNDIDCATGPECGGEVCDWNASMTCRAATGSPKGMEGWCTTSTDCKCMGEGATCNGTQHCTITVAPAGGTAGASGTAGATSGSAGSSSAGASSSTAGASATAGSSSSSSSDDSSGGCSISERAPKKSLAALLGAACAAAIFGARRRRRVA